MMDDDYFYPSSVFTFQKLRVDLDKHVKELSHFKTVMQTIQTIQTTTLSVELKIHEMQEIYSILEEHRIKVGSLLFASIGA